MKTVGTSPKLYAAVAAAILSYLLTQEVVDFPAWADLLINVGSIGLAVWIANPGTVQPAPDPELEQRDIHEVT